MYFIVAWDIRANEPDAARINERMKNGFRNYQYVCPVNTFYVVKVSNVEQYNQIHECLALVAETSRAVNFIMSPLLMAQGYRAWLPTEVWQKVLEVVG